MNGIAHFCFFSSSTSTKTKKKRSTSTTSQDGERRVRGVELVLPVVLGSCAFPLGKKATDAETHKWTVYVRGATPKKTNSAAGQPSSASAPALPSAEEKAIAAAGEDISDIVSKVVFNLHPTFHNPTREVSEPPFELSEMGWGEFDLTAVLHFVDAAGEPPLELAHKLRLYSDADPQGTNLKKPVVAEVYDEVVFTEPREAFWRAASKARGGGGGGPGGPAFVGLRPSPRPYSTAAHFGAPAPEDELRRLGVARQRVAQVMMAVRKQMDTLDAHAAAGGSAAQFAAAQQQRRAQQQQMQMQQKQQQLQQQQQAQAAAAAAAAAGLPPGFPPPEAMMM